MIVLYAVVYSDDETNWRVIVDETADREVPAVYVHEGDADNRCEWMRFEFTDHAYKVVEVMVDA